MSPNAQPTSSRCDALALPILCLASGKGICLLGSPLLPSFAAAIEIPISVLQVAGIFNFCVFHVQMLSTFLLPAFESQAILLRLPRADASRAFPFCLGDGPRFFFGIFHAQISSVSLLPASQLRALLLRLPHADVIRVLLAIGTINFCCTFSTCGCNPCPPCD